MSKRTQAPVTVAEMIIALQKLPPETRVFTSGYEGGYEDAGLPEGVKPAVFYFNENECGYYGPYERASDIEIDYHKHDRDNPITGIVL